ncbi:TRAP-type C4-dicarboxylate transport system substrate-binding protein [Sporosarcina luteola]|nr:TRAP-type C4-dicarboxylate transport system substrate-binding protein [Sporosarcina luteola]
MEKVGEESNIKVMGAMYRGGRIVTSKKPFTTPEEVKGLKIRVPAIEMYLETWKELGASPTPMGITEIYTGLQQGTVDAQENPMTNSYDFGFPEVAPYLIVTNHSYNPSVFMMDRKKFGEFPEDIQKLIEEAAQDAADYRSQYVVDIEEDYLQKYIDDGREVIYPDNEAFEQVFDGFIEEKFPYLVDYVERIKAVE